MDERQRRRPQGPSTFSLLAYGVMACAAAWPLAVPLVSWMNVTLLGGSEFDELILLWGVPVGLLAIFLAVSLLAGGPGTHRENAKVWLLVCLVAIVGSELGANAAEQAVPAVMLTAGLGFGTIAPIVWLVREWRGDRRVRRRPQTRSS
jgi:hypothetical protein